MLVKEIINSEGIKNICASTEDGEALFMHCSGGKISVDETEFETLTKHLLFIHGVTFLSYICLGDEDGGAV